MKRGFKHRIPVMSILFASVFFSSCFNPISLEVAQQIDDEDGPELVIITPVDRSEYSTVVEVSGTVTDNIGGDLPEGTYQVSGTTIAGSFQPGSDGSFVFSFATRESDSTTLVSGPFSLEVTANDRSGNSTTKIIQLLPVGSGDISDFSLTPGNGQVTISWGAVPGAERYNLYNPRYGEIRTDVTSPYVWDELKNGSLYSFQLGAFVSEGAGDDAWSSLEDVIPLSVRTLAPRVAETGYRFIKIEWNDFSGVEEYVIERQVEGGSWSIRSITSGNTFEDTSLNHDTSYAYRIKPESQYDIVSSSCTGVPGRFVSNPDILHEDTSSDARDVAVSGSYAYVADQSNGLAIINISNPSNPGTPLYVNTNGSANGVAVSGSYAYVADGGSGLAIIDISNPTNPGTPVYEDTTGTAREVAISGSYAYVACDTSGLAVIDISDPANPGAPVYEDTARAYGVAVSGSYAYVADDSSGLAVIDISNPANPGAPIYENTSGTAIDVAISGSYAYVADSDGLAVIDISNPTNPGLPVYEGTNGFCIGVAVSGSYAYLADFTGGFATINISDPDNPGAPVYTDTSGNPWSVALSGIYAYVVGDNQLLSVIEITAPATSVSAVYVDTGSGFIRDLAVDGSYVYSANSLGGLKIVDISDPDNPGAPVQKDTNGQASGVIVSGSYAYVANYDHGLAIIDVSNPAAPGNPVYMDTDGNALDVAVSGSYAYVADETAGLAIIDIADPENPGAPVYRDTNGNAIGVAVSGSYAYLACGTSGLAIINISDPANPGNPAYVNTTLAYKVTVSGSYAYVADATQGLTIIDIADPENPGTPIVAFPGTDAKRVVVSGSYAYVNGNKFTIVDVSDPLNPASIYNNNSLGGEGGAISGSYAFVSTNSDEIAIIKLLED